MGKALYCFWPSVVFSSLGGFLGFPLPFFSASAFRLRMSFPLPPERLGDGSERHQTLTFGGRVELLYYFE